jgi:hypothetical protein
MDVAPGPALATIDARGGTVVIVRVWGVDMNVCNALQVLPSGELMGAGSGKSDWPLPPAVEHEAAIDEVEVAAIEGGELKVRGWSVQGRVGPAIKLVVVRPARGPVVMATLENGWFAAWWPVPLGPEGGRVSPQFRVDGYDSANALRATLSQ